jgi:hypothetical protein
MRKFYLEPEKPPEIVEIQMTVDPSWWSALLRLFGIHTEARVETRQDIRITPRRWRWQTHAEVEEESGIVRHDTFFGDETHG